MADATKKRYKLSKVALCLMLFLVAVGLILFVSVKIDMRLIDKNALVLGHEIPTLNSCIENLYPKFENINGFNKASDACYVNLRNQGLLNDFQIRRAKFSLQYSSNKIILWMLVILTLSGIVLAGFQFFAAYRLAQSSQNKSLEMNHEFSIEEGKMVFKSSMAGLFIIIFSFAFFYVYIWKVYTIYEVNPDEGQAEVVSSFGGGIGIKPDLEVGQSPDK